ncbi:cupin domain-containing protein [bacterium]|nr:cupin domain-containing protein [bacterium]
MGSPHWLDEVYYIVLGRAMLEVGKDEIPAQPGLAVYVRAEVKHRFHSISEDLQVPTALICLPHRDRSMVKSVWLPPGESHLQDIFYFNLSVFKTQREEL